MAPVEPQIKNRNWTIPYSVHTTRGKKMFWMWRSGRWKTCDLRLSSILTHSSQFWKSGHKISIRLLIPQPRSIGHIRRLHHAFKDRQHFEWSLNSVLRCELHVVDSEVVREDGYVHVIWPFCLNVFPWISSIKLSEDEIRHTLIWD